MQFYAVEIVRYVSENSALDYMLMWWGRNREGLNDWIYEKAQGQNAS